MSHSPAAALRSFLEAPTRPAGTLQYHELQGFLFAVASSPELVKPSEWMPIVFGDQGAEYESLDEAREVIGELMALYNSVNAVVGDDRAALPTDCPFRSEPLANLEDDAPVAQWSRGFLRGHQWLEDIWDSYVPEELDDELAAVLLTLSFFASKELAEAFRAETGRLELAEMAATICLVFDNAVAEYAHLGRSIHKILMAYPPSGTGQPSRLKVGRNDLCPCGSGRKYKRSCGGRRQ
jgi:uncharacterized protein